MVDLAYLLYRRTNKLSGVRRPVSAMERKSLCTHIHVVATRGRGGFAKGVTLCARRRTAEHFFNGHIVKPAPQGQQTDNSCVKMAARLAALLSDANT